MSATCAKFPPFSDQTLARITKLPLLLPSTVRSVPIARIMLRHTTSSQCYLYNIQTTARRHYCPSPFAMLSAWEAHGVLVDGRASETFRLSQLVHVSLLIQLKNSVWRCVERTSWAFSHAPTPFTLDADKCPPSPISSRHSRKSLWPADESPGVSLVLILVIFTRYIIYHKLVWDQSPMGATTCSAFFFFIINESVLNYCGIY